MTSLGVIMAAKGLNYTVAGQSRRPDIFKPNKRIYMKRFITILSWQAEISRSTSNSLAFHAINNIQFLPVKHSFMLRTVQSSFQIGLVPICTMVGVCGRNCDRLRGLIARCNKSNFLTENVIKTGMKSRSFAFANRARSRLVVTLNIDKFRAILNRQNRQNKRQ